MYHLPYFKEKNFETVVAFMKAHPFAVLTGVSADHKPVATQVPFLFAERNGKLVLRGHVMRNTDHHKAFQQNPHVLALFTGPHTYVSASLYTDPQQGSTWNYITVQAQGELSFLEEADLRQVLRDTTTHFEGGPHTPGAYENLPEEYIAKLIKAIVGIEIVVTQIDNVFKLSQNRDEASYDNIINDLNEGTEDARRIALEMEERRSQLFKR
ncbi:FMN-binding negative transcriptional regulator [Paraflavitalea sp. CAU 1676]|uniref:FMN-binding negative transcriptional regulator n=1 Tax=Paraflavitalea sp. CAU 1676 TaxID=3032598 RepID=UPI0023DBBBA2|nr:FMN-binding negative transcriptional regulator [Paraflavitalea sp. CAU 1676]MDF2192529.1 FMN-binding negative transcriptional regulator [Paraflavitalea sp. CAU 1676]